MKKPAQPDFFGGALIAATAEPPAAVAPEEPPPAAPEVVEEPPTEEAPAPMLPPVPAKVCPLAEARTPLNSNGYSTVGYIYHVRFAGDVPAGLDAKTSRLGTEWFALYQVRLGPLGVAMNVPCAACGTQAGPYRDETGRLCEIEAYAPSQLSPHSPYVCRRCIDKVFNPQPVHQ